MNYIRLPLTTAMQMWRSLHWADPEIAKSIGVSVLQVHYYRNGKTKVPNPKVIMAIFNNLVIDGDKVLIDLYKGYDDLKEHYDRYVNNMQQPKLPLFE